MILAVTLIFLMICTLLTSAAMENNLLNQKMSGALQAQIIAFNSAEAGLAAQEAKLMGQEVNMANIPGEVNSLITKEVEDPCQQHIYTILTTAAFQHAQVKLSSAFLQARAPPLPECAGNQPSHRLWWQQVEV